MGMTRRKALKTGGGATLLTFLAVVRSPQYVE